MPTCCPLVVPSLGPTAAAAAAAGRRPVASFTRALAPGGVRRTRWGSTQRAPRSVRLTQRITTTAAAERGKAAPSSSSSSPTTATTADAVVVVAPPKGPGSAAAALQDADSVEEVLAAAHLLVLPGRVATPPGCQNLVPLASRAPTHRPRQQARCRCAPTPAARRAARNPPAPTPSAG
jgi:hypothetical protein